MVKVWCYILTSSTFAAVFAEVSINTNPCSLAKSWPCKHNSKHTLLQRYAKRMCACICLECLGSNGKLCLSLKKFGYKTSSLPFAYLIVFHFSSSFQVTVQKGYMAWISHGTRYLHYIYKLL